jgi:nicotinate-nucleotide adenylyltransferase
MRTAVFGGTFDPVHIGHLVMADEVLSQLQYDQIRFMPARIAPHKSGEPSASAGHRLAMLRLATAERDKFVVDQYELEREGPSYTVRTLRHLISSGIVTGTPGLIIGMDLVAGFDAWREADEVERLADLILVRRPSSDGGHQTPCFDRKHHLVDNVTLAVSATEIRRRVPEGLPFRYLVTPEVYGYIRDEKLYRSMTAGDSSSRSGTDDA